MSLKPRKINKKEFKQIAGKCRICKTDIYAILDVHRIQGGNDSEESPNANEYVESNVVVLCASCHRKVHAKQIIIERWHNSTMGRLLHIIENGVDKFV